MITYVDTSTLVKLLIDEPGTATAGVIWDQPEVLAMARVGYVEAHAALGAARRQNRITEPMLNAATEGLELLWSQLSIVEIDEAVAHDAASLAVEHGLRGYDAIHLAAARAIGADVFSSADRRLCRAASASGFHIANPGDAIEPDAEAPAAGPEAASAITWQDSGVHGVPLPSAAVALDEEFGGYRLRGSTIQDLTAAYKDRMSTDGWIFDVDASVLDPYVSDERPHVGYLAHASYVKPTNPPTTVAVIIGNYDGRPGNKRDLRLYVTPTPDDDLPRRALHLGWIDDGKRPTQLATTAASRRKGHPNSASQ